MKFLHVNTFTASSKKDWNMEHSTVFNTSLREAVLSQIKSHWISESFSLDENRAYEAVTGVSEAYHIPLVYIKEPMGNGKFKEISDGELIVSEKTIEFKPNPAYGRIGRKVTIWEEEIEDNDLGFLIVEEFHTFPMLAPSVMAFYEPPVTTLEEAEDKLENFEHHDNVFVFGVGKSSPTAFILPYSMKNYEAEKKNPISFVSTCMHC